MEMPGGSVLFVTLLSVFFLVILLFKRYNSKRSSLRLPPGPPKLPIIGNLHQFAAAGSLPHRALRDLASKYGPLMHLQLGENSSIVITSAELAKEILTVHDINFANRPHFLAATIITYNNNDIGFLEYGNQWRQLRKLCTLELLTTKRVRSFRFIREEEVSNLVKAIAENEGSVVNLSEKIYKCTNTTTARAAFGKNSRDQDPFLSTLTDVIELLGSFAIADLFPSVKVLPWITGVRAKAERVHKTNDIVLENILRDHREKKETNREQEENLLDILHRIQKEKDNDLGMSLTHQVMKSIILEMFVAGSETSAMITEWAMAELIKNPKVMEKAQAEVRSVCKGKEFVDESEIHQLKYLSAVVKETLRLHPPAVLLLPRINKESCVINGYDIPSKTKVFINAWAIARDPKYWDEAKTFKPERFLENLVDYKGTNFEYIPFGAGRRMCPGSSFAIPNIELPLANMLYHFDWKIPNGMTSEEFDMSEHFGLGVSRKQKLHLIPIRYRPQP